MMRRICKFKFLLLKFQFLKKVQRQERIVEEIKNVLKPYYNRKRINKEDYKNILRKCVPKVSLRFLFYFWRFFLILNNCFRSVIVRKVILTQQKSKSWSRGTYGNINTQRKKEDLFHHNHFLLLCFFVIIYNKMLSMINFHF